MEWATPPLRSTAPPPGGKMLPSTVHVEKRESLGATSTRDVAYAPAPVSIPKENVEGATSSGLGVVRMVSSDPV